MRVLKIWDSEYPWDVRAEKVASALTAAGHEVHMVARNRDGRTVVERLPECTVHRLDPLPGIAGIPRIGAALNAASMFPAFFNPRWYRKISTVGESTRAEVIVCRDLPLTPTAVAAGRRLGIPVILDMAENYPAMIRAVWENGRHRWSDWLVRNPALVERVERWALRTVDHILVVVEESRDRLIALGVPPERITVVSNTPPRERTSVAVPERIDRPTNAPLELVYLGLLEAPRGISTLIDAVGRCRSDGLDVRLTLIGDGREREQFESMARSVDPSSEAIRFLGYLPNAEARARLVEADAGVIPHHADESWNTTIPNKLFDYMAAGIGVIASDARPVKRIVEETGCGLVYRDRDPEDLARVIKKLRDPILQARLRSAGRDAVARRYHWDADAERLVDALDETLRRRRGAGPAPTSPIGERVVGV